MDIYPSYLIPEEDKGNSDKKSPSLLLGLPQLQHLHLLPRGWPEQREQDEEEEEADSVEEEEEVEGQDACRSVQGPDMGDYRAPSEEYARELQLEKIAEAMLTTSRASQSCPGS